MRDVSASGEQRYAPHFAFATAKLLLLIIDF